MTVTTDNGVGADLRRGRYPSGGHAKKVAAVLRRTQRMAISSSGGADR